MNLHVDEIEASDWSVWLPMQTLQPFLKLSILKTRKILMKNIDST